VQASHISAYRQPIFVVSYSLFNSRVQMSSDPSPRNVSQRSVYRAMHFSAKRGIAIACRLSVCLSVRNVEVL